MLPAEYVLSATELARERGLATHLDGARLFNAVVATDTSPKQLCLPFDSVSLCFSKGLGTPMGSALVGSQALIDRARRWRKVVGGGMRQSGIIAAACQHALDHHVADLADDHRRAARLAEGLAKLPGVEITSQATNMVFAHFPDEHVQPLSTWLKEHGILIELLYTTRFVTHRDINDADIDKVIAVMEAYFSLRLKARPVGERQLNMPISPRCKPLTVYLQMLIQPPRLNRSARSTPRISAMPRNRPMAG